MATNHPKFDKTNIRWIHDKLSTVLINFCKENGLEYVGSNLKYTEESFDAKVSVRVPGGLTIKEKRDALGSDLDKNGTPIKAGDFVTAPDGTRYSIFGFKRVKVVVQDVNGKKWLIPSGILTKAA